ncbi:MAG: GNAT family N-acetyltransferase [Dehalococcoidia bacterium]
MSETLGRRALDVDLALLALGNETFEAEGALFVRNRELPLEREANFVANVTASTPDEIERLLTRVERELAGLPYRRFDVDHDAQPAFEARLLLDGYRREETIVSVLEGDLVGEAKPADIRPVDNESAWQARAALVAASWPDYEERAGASADRSASSGQALESAIRSGRAKSPPLRYWLAYVDGEAQAYGASWPGIEGMGQVEYLFTHPDFRHRGLATALIHRAVAGCRERGAGPVAITADASDTPKQIYAAMGFRPVAMKRTYLREVAT